jgi:hypothetical protein
MATFFMEWPRFVVKSMASSVLEAEGFWTMLRGSVASGGGSPPKLYGCGNYVA